jgi:hypothetical protein
VNQETVWTPERQQRARAEAQRWAGTKHVNRLAVHGAGIDCVNLVSEILIAAGLIERRRMPFYDERLGSLRSRNVIEDILTGHLHAESIPAAAGGQFGDIVVCQCGRQTNHVGILIDGMMWHVPGRGRVGPEAWETWRPRTQNLVRIVGIGYKADPAALTWDKIRAIIPA